MFVAGSTWFGLIHVNSFKGTTPTGVIIRMLMLSYLRFLAGDRWDKRVDPCHATEQCRVRSKNRQYILTTSSDFTARPFFSVMALFLRFVA